MKISIWGFLNLNLSKMNQITWTFFFIEETYDEMLEKDFYLFLT